MGIEQGRADPDFRYPGVIFYRCDDPFSMKISTGQGELILRSA